ncbi:MAG: sigma-70 family RNA polymerase sigma factor [Alicyclobacillaceae bacterium]|nr:sigma-70 family RNA polymerase sigma factor [Alicyclobacillaceae bacterium]
MDDRQEVFTKLMQTYGKQVWRYLYTLTRDTHTADDLTQDVFTRAYQSLDHLRDPAAAQTWLFTIARNRCKDHFKSSFYRRVRSSDRVDAEDPRRTEDEVLQHIEQHEVLSALFQLKPIFREVVLLRVKEDLAFQDIARITGITESTAKVRYQRAVRQMRKLLERGGGHS